MESFSPKPVENIATHEELKSLSAQLRRLLNELFEIIASSQKRKTYPDTGSIYPALYLFEYQISAHKSKEMIRAKFIDLTAEIARKLSTFLTKEGTASVLQEKIDLIMSVLHLIAKIVEHDCFDFAKLLKQSSKPAYAKNTLRPKKVLDNEA